MRDVTFARAHDIDSAKLFRVKLRYLEHMRQAQERIVAQALPTHPSVDPFSETVFPLSARLSLLHLNERTALLADAYYDVDPAEMIDFFEVPSSVLKAEAQAHVPFEATIAPFLHDGTVGVAAWTTEALRDFLTSCLVSKEMPETARAQMVENIFLDVADPSLETALVSFNEIADMNITAPQALITSLLPLTLKELYAWLALLHSDIKAYTDLAAFYVTLRSLPYCSQRATATLKPEFASLGEQFIAMIERKVDVLEVHLSRMTTLSSMLNLFRRCLMDDLSSPSWPILLHEYLQDQDSSFLAQLEAPELHVGPIPKQSWSTLVVSIFVDAQRMIERVYWQIAIDFVKEYVGSSVLAAQTSASDKGDSADNEGQEKGKEGSQEGQWKSGRALKEQNERTEEMLDEVAKVDRRGVREAEGQRVTPDTDLKSYADLKEMQKHVNPVIEFHREGSDVTYTCHDPWLEQSIANLDQARADLEASENPENPENGDVLRGQIESAFSKQLQSLIAVAQRHSDDRASSVREGRDAILPPLTSRAAFLELMRSEMAGSFARNLLSYLNAAADAAGHSIGGAIADAVTRKIQENHAGFSRGVTDGADPLVEGPFGGTNESPTDGSAGKSEKEKAKLKAKRQRQKQKRQEEQAKRLELAAVERAAANLDAFNKSNATLLPLPSRQTWRLTPPMAEDAVRPIPSWSVSDTMHNVRWHRARVTEKVAHLQKQSEAMIDGALSAERVSDLPPASLCSFKQCHAYALDQRERLEAIRVHLMEEPPSVSAASAITDLDETLKREALLLHVLRSRYYPTLEVS